MSIDVPTLLGEMAQRSKPEYEARFDVVRGIIERKAAEYARLVPAEDEEDDETLRAAQERYRAIDWKSEFEPIPAEDEGRLREAATALLIAVDNASFDALNEAEDGSPEPEWQERLWDAANAARAALAATPEPR